MNSTQSTPQPGTAISRFISRVKQSLLEGGYEPIVPALRDYPVVTRLPR